jgi:hypothetical protein
LPRRNWFQHRGCWVRISRIGWMAGIAEYRWIWLIGVDGVEIAWERESMRHQKNQVVQRCLFLGRLQKGPSLWRQMTEVETCETCHRKHHFRVTLTILKYLKLVVRIYTVYIYLHTYTHEYRSPNNFTWSPNQLPSRICQLRCACHFP